MGTNTWTKVELYGANNDGNPRRYTIADGVSVSKGDLMALIDERTTSAAIAQTVFAGVASEEHIGGQGITDISVWTDGIFDVVNSGAIGLGAPLTGCAVNAVKSTLVGGTTGASGAQIIGYSLGIAAVDVDERINVRLLL